MLDSSSFATHWLDDDCELSNDYCQGTDLDGSSSVDINDLEAFTETWLAGVAPLRLSIHEVVRVLRYPRFSLAMRRVYLAERLRYF